MAQTTLSLAGVLLVAGAALLELLELPELLPLLAGAMLPELAGALLPELAGALEEPPQAASVKIIAINRMTDTIFFMNNLPSL
jgi:hypothetical protein